MAQATYDIWVKGSPEKNELGDCKSLLEFPPESFDDVLRALVIERRWRCIEVYCRHCIDQGLLLQAHSLTV